MIYFSGSKCWFKRHCRPHSQYRSNSFMVREKQSGKSSQITRKYHGILSSNGKNRISSANGSINSSSTIRFGDTPVNQINIPEPPKTNWIATAMFSLAVTMLIDNYSTRICSLLPRSKVFPLWITKNWQQRVAGTIKIGSLDIGLPSLRWSSKLCLFSIKRLFCSSKILHALVTRLY